MPQNYYRGFYTGNTLKRCGLKAPTDGHFRVNVASGEAVELENGMEFAPGLVYSLKKRQQWRLRDYVAAALRDSAGQFEGDRVEVAEGLVLGRRSRVFYMATKGSKGRLWEQAGPRCYVNRHGVSAAFNVSDDAVKEGWRSLSFDFVEPRHGANLSAKTSSGHYKLSAHSAASALDPRLLLEDKDAIEVEVRAQVARDRLEDAAAPPSCPPPEHNLSDYVIAKEGRLPRAARRRRCSSSKSSNEEAPPGVKDRKVMEACEEAPDSGPLVAPTPAWMELGGEASLSAPADLLEMAPLRVRLPSAQLTRSALHAAFGSRHLEGCSEPRKFALSIADALSRELRAATPEPASPTKAAPPQALLLFEVVQADPEWTVCDVRLNADVTGPRLLRLPPNAASTGASLAAFVERCVANTAAAFGPHLQRRPVAVTFRYLRRPNGGPPAPLGTTVAADTGEWEVVGDSEASDAFEVVDPTCRACLAPLAIAGEASALSEAAATAEVRSGCCLAPCGHHFCGDCWRWHLASQIQLGRAQLRCPDPDCSEAVDPVTALRFVSLPLYAQHSEQLTPAARGSPASTDPRLALCPATECGLATRLSRPPPPGRALNVECPARHSFCFSCREEAHWPAPCAAYKLYQAKLAAQGGSEQRLEPGSGRSKHFNATVRWRHLRRRGAKAGPLQLSSSRLGELLFQHHSQRPSHAEVQREACRVVSNYEELLRIVEFAHVACLCLVNAQLSSTGRVLRASAHKLTGLAAAIRECVNNSASAGQRLDNKAAHLHSLFAQARGILAAIQNLSALHEPSCMRKLL